MKTYVWLLVCWWCLCGGFCLGTWMAYGRERQRMLKRAEEEMKRMDELAEACKKQIEYAYRSAAQMVGVDLRDLPAPKTQPTPLNDAGWGIVGGIND